jgi:hypothetical protein
LRVPSPDGSSEAEVAVTVTLAGSGGVYTEFLQSSADARTSERIAFDTAAKGPAHRARDYPLGKKPAAAIALRSANQRVREVRQPLTGSPDECRKPTHWLTPRGFETAPVGEPREPSQENVHSGRLPSPGSTGARMSKTARVNNARENQSGRSKPARCRCLPRLNVRMDSIKGRGERRSSASHRATSRRWMDANPSCASRRCAAPRVPAITCAETPNSCAISRAEWGRSGKRSEGPITVNSRRLLYFLGGIGTG